MYLQVVSLQHVACNISGFCDDCKCARSSREEDDKSEPEQLLGFTETYAAYKTVKSLFCMHITAKHYEKKVLNFGTDAISSEAECCDSVVVKDRFSFLEICDFHIGIKANSIFDFYLCTHKCKTYVI